MKIKQLLCGVLAAAVLFTGCGAQPGTSGGSVRRGRHAHAGQGSVRGKRRHPAGRGGLYPVSLTARPDGGLTTSRSGLPRRPVNIHIPILFC